MQLRIFCEDDTVQVINLHKSFVLDKDNMREVYYLLSFGEVNRKAFETAKSVVGDDLYRSHQLVGYDDFAAELRA